MSEPALTSPTEPVLTESTPPELRELPRWMPWRWEERDGKRTKPPLHCTQPNQHGKVNDPRTWGTFDQALAVVQASKADGVGVVVPDELAGVDLDHCRDRESGELTPLATATVETLSSYAEVTPSGEGIRVWVRAPGVKFERQKHPDLGVELYTEARYFAVTGNALNGSHIQERSAELAAWWDDMGVLATACKSNERCLPLFRGTGHDYASDSEADLALASMLAARADGREQVERILRHSALWDEKWERDDYREATLAKALEPQREKREIVEQTRLENLRDLPGHVALENLRVLVRRYIAMTDEQATTVALWVAHTHAIEAAETTLYLHVTSAEKRSGKSRLLEVLKLLVYNPVSSANMSAAVLFRVVEGSTMLLDEVDAVFNSQRSADTTEALRGILNAGYRKNEYAHRAQPKGNTVEVLSFAVFGAKVLAGIGELPDTIADRCVRIHLRRAVKPEKVERMRHREVEPEAKVAAGELARWVQSVENLADARPQLPEELNDRLADGWEPLLAIADAAGGDWPEQARKAALVLAGEATDDADESLGVALLRDIKELLKDNDRIRSADLVERLCRLADAQWWDEHLNQYRLSRMLKPFGIKPRTIQLGHGEKARTTAKGYLREQFEDAWRRYL